jgi:catechol 2,3-dioxygenase-like lactoylglutathione lyase family enzyme
MPSPIYDLAGLTLEVNDLERATTFYQTLFGLETVHRSEHSSVCLRVSEHQTLTLWQPVTRRPLIPWLASLFPRGAAHLHYAWQILPEDFDLCRQTLKARGVAFQEIDLGTPERPDPGLYFFDPFSHGLELRTVDLNDARSPYFPPQPRPPGRSGLPVIGLREVALAFADYPAMLTRLPDAYGFAFAKEQEDRDFAQFTLGPHAEADGNGTPRRWLYAWDPQVGLADMMGGDHALVEFYAEVPQVLERVRHAGLPFLEHAGELAVKDPEGHTFVFRPLPS